MIGLHNAKCFVKHYCKSNAIQASGIVSIYVRKLGFHCVGCIGCSGVPTYDRFG